MFSSKRFPLILALSVFSIALFAQQDSRLADQYFLDGEFEKAAEIYAMLYRTSNRSDFYFSKYIETLMAMGDFETSEDIINNHLGKDPANVSLYVSLGNVLERQNKFDEASVAFQQAIDRLPADLGQITRLGNAFLMLTKYDEAIAAYEKGQHLLKRPDLFAENLADLYRRKGDTEKMIENYLYSLQNNPQRLSGIQTILQRHLATEDYKILQMQLYAMVQDFPEADHFPEMLAWVFIQQKDFMGALQQMRALDQRLDENGHRVFRLAQMASNATDYKAAIAAYEYIVENKGPGSPFYLRAKEASLDNQRRKIVHHYDYTTEDLLRLDAEYESFINEIGRNRTTASLLLDQARLSAFYINDLPKAITLLEELIAFPGVRREVRAQAKLDLADFHLMKGDIWEATLLYSQVDKELREDALGEEARFRNARLSYFNGDFEWAQAQFDILKAATSRLIANDAIDMSVFIMDNLGLDTSAHALSMYAESELLVFQNRFAEAEEKLTILSNIYPDHGLQDDIIYLRARLFEKQRRFEEAAALFEEVFTRYPDDIRADNALFALAELYQNVLNEPIKAKELYERIFIEYSGSTFSVEARKRFRMLRGDLPGEPVN